MNGQPIRVLELSGTPYDMGYAHGAAYRGEIRAFAEERVRLSGDPLWTGRAFSRGEVLELAEACLAEHERFVPELVEELRSNIFAAQNALADVSNYHLTAIAVFALDNCISLKGRAAPKGPPSYIHSANGAAWIIFPKPLSNK